MDTTTIIIATLAATSVVGLAWLGGYRLGLDTGINAERKLANRRVNGVLAEENARKASRRIPQRRRLTYRKVDAKSVGKKRYLNSRLVGAVISTGEVRV